MERLANRPIKEQMKHAIDVNPRAVRFTHGAISATMTAANWQGCVHIDNVIEQVLRDGALPSWPPIPVIEKLDNGTKRFHAIDGNRRLYVARVAWQHGVIASVKVIVCDSCRANVADKYADSSTSGCGGVEVEVREPGSRYIEDLRKCRDRQEDFYWFLFSVHRKLQQATNSSALHAEAKSAALKVAHDLQHRFFCSAGPGASVDGLHRLEFHDAECCSISILLHRQIEIALRLPTLTAGGLFAQGWWLADDTKQGRACAGRWALAGRELIGPENQVLEIENAETGAGGAIVLHVKGTSSRVSGDLVSDWGPDQQTWTPSAIRWGSASSRLPGSRGDDPMPCGTWNFQRRFDETDQAPERSCPKTVPSCRRLRAMPKKRPIPKANSEHRKPTDAELMRLIAEDLSNSEGEDKEAGEPRRYDPDRKRWFTFREMCIALRGQQQMSGEPLTPIQLRQYWETLENARPINEVERRNRTAPSDRSQATHPWYTNVDAGGDVSIPILVNGAVMDDVPFNYERHGRAALRLPGNHPCMIIVESLEASSSRLKLRIRHAVNDFEPDGNENAVDGLLDLRSGRRKFIAPCPGCWRKDFICIELRSGPLTSPSSVSKCEAGTNGMEDRTTEQADPADARRPPRPSSSRVDDGFDSGMHGHAYVNEGSATEDHNPQSHEKTGSDGHKRRRRRPRENQVADSQGSQHMRTPCRKGVSLGIAGEDSQQRTQCSAHEETIKQGIAEKPETSSEPMGPKLAVVGGGTPLLLAVLFDGSSIFSEATNVLGTFLGNSNADVYLDTGSQARVVDPILAERVDAAFTSSGSEWDGTHWQLVRAVDSAAGGRPIMAVGAGSNQKGRSRSAKLALALAMSISDGDPDKCSWCPGFAELAKHAAHLLKRRPECEQQRPWKRQRELHNVWV